MQRTTYKLLAATMVALLVVLGGLAIVSTAFADPFFFSTGDPDGKIATGSRPASAGKIEIESADDFVLNSMTSITSATFTGLVTGTAPTIGQVIVQIYRVFPKDSDVGRTSGPPVFSTPQVPTRVNSPSDVAFFDRDSAAGTLSFSTTTLANSFTVANTVLNGIHPIPNQTTGGDGPATGAEVVFTVNFITPLTLPADHYFLVPQVQVTGGEFLWLSAPRPIVPPGTPFPSGSTDLQSWIRNANLDPDWLRVGTDIVGGNPAPTFNAAFSLIGFTTPVPEGESPYIAIVDNDALTYKPFYFSPKHTQFLFDQSPTGLAQAAPVCFGSFPPVNQYTRAGGAGCEQFRSQTLNNQAEVCDTTGVQSPGAGFVDRGLKNAVTPAGNAGSSTNGSSAFRRSHRGKLTSCSSAVS